MVSPRKSASSVNLDPEEYGSSGNVNRLTPSNRKSCDSLYSAPSSRASASVVYRRKVPANFANRQPALIPATTEVQQRVISARRLRFKNVQNQLGLAQHKITELTNELRVLRTLHKRQNSALAKYESTNAELPRLLHSHAEELRVWQTKYRTLQASHKELEQKLKQKEAIILALGDENKYYSQLSKDKNLEDRQRLADKIQLLEQRLQEKDNQIKVAERRSHLEIKNLKQQLANEQKKTKDVLQKLEKARIDLSNYQKLEELNITEKLSSMSIKQTHTKMELKSNSRKISKEKPFGGSMINSSKTPSPALDNASGGDFDEELDYPMSHRTQKSTCSSMNVDFSTTRTVRQLSLSTTAKKPSKEPTSTIQMMKDNAAEIIGDGPDLKNKTYQESYDKKSNSHKPTMKMMVNIPNFDADGAGDGDASILGDGDDTDVVLVDELNNGNDFDNDIDYNYADDFDENDDDGGNERELCTDDDLNFNNDNGELHANGNDNDEYDNDEADNLTSRSKESIMNIRKQITDDYRDREAFLDTFCRQTTGPGIRTKADITASKKVPGNNGGQATSNRKHKLLAALKAIDDDQCSGSQD